MSLADALNDARNLVAEGKSNRGGYVTLDQLLDECRRVMAAHGYAVVQSASSDDGVVAVTSMVVDSEDRKVFESGRYGVPVQDRNGQAYGAALTFARRGSLMSLLGITGGSEDSVVPRGQVASLGAAFSRAGISGREDRLALVEQVLSRTVESSKELTEEETRQVIMELEEMRP